MSYNSIAASAGDQAFLLPRLKRAPALPVSSVKFTTPFGVCSAGEKRRLR